MKKTLFIVGISLLVIGIIGMVLTNDQIEKEQSTQTHSISGSYNNIKLDIGQGMVKVIPSKDEKTTLTVTQNKSKRNYKYEIKNDTLFIEATPNSKERKADWVKGTHRNTDLAFTLRVPHKHLKSFNAESLFGSIDIDQMKADKSSLNVHVGEINVKQLISKDTTIKTGTGDISVKELNSDNAHVSVNIGSMTLSEINPDINIDGKIGTGDGLFEYRTAPEQTHFNIDSRMGEINMNNFINVPENQAAAKVALNVDTGSVTFKVK